MDGILLAIGVLLLTGVLAAVAHRQPRASVFLVTTGHVVAVLFAFPFAIDVLVTAHVSPPIRLTWLPLVGEACLFQLDPLSAFFCLPTLFVATLAVLFQWGPPASLPRNESRGGFYLTTNLLTSGMLVVITARNGLCFLAGWEIVSLAALMLIIWDAEPTVARRLRWRYLLTSQTCAMSIGLFLLLWRQHTGSFDLLAAPQAWPTVTWRGTTWFQFWPSLLFLLAILGFGATGGIAPLRGWMPQTFAQAPGHVSAVLAGGMGQLGVYGLLRAITLVGSDDPQWNMTWGVALITFGVASAVAAMINAVSQRELRTLLAFSSVEQVGVMGMGMGMGLLGRSLPPVLDGESTGNVIALLGFGSVLLHTLNHALNKSLLFFGADVVERATHTTELNALGGLAQRMPWTTFLFLVGSMARCGLPPLNGFASRFLLYSAAVQEEVHAVRLDAIPALAIIGGLALCGGLSAIAFTKALGIGFLGLPRTRAAAEAKETHPLRLLPMLAAAAGCIVLGLLAPRVVVSLQPVLQLLVLPAPPLHLAAQLRETLTTLEAVGIMSAVLIGVVLLLAGCRWCFVSAAESSSIAAWDGGYARPEVRFQPRAALYADGVSRWFGWLARSPLKLSKSVSDAVPPHDPPADGNLSQASSASAGEKLADSFSTDKKLSGDPGASGLLARGLP